MLERIADITVYSIDVDLKQHLVVGLIDEGSNARSEFGGGISQRRANRRVAKGGAGK